MRRFKKPNLFSRYFQPSSLEGRPDYILITLLFIIVLFGLVMLSSASSVVSYKDFGDTYYFLKQQIFKGLIPGLILFFILSKINYFHFKKFTFLFLGISILLLALVFVPGLSESYGRAKSWVNLGIFNFQPSEVVKLTFLIFLSGWLASKTKREIKNFWLGFIPFIAVLGLTAILIALEPDIGTMVIFVIIALGVFFVAGGKIIHLIWMILVGGGGLAFYIIQAPYQAKRLLTFLNPEFDPQGIGYHINQAFLAIGSGGWFGRGFGKSLQKFAYLPQAYSDSIFAIITEELGFMVAVGLIILFFILVFRGLKISQSAPDEFGQLLAGGIIIWIAGQAFLNIAAMVGIVPLTGIPLPFISHGGTALASNLAAMGILVNISKQT